MILIALGCLSGCATSRPHNVENVCQIFYQYPKWYWQAKDTQRKWGVPVSTQMAIMYQESRFTSDAKPPRRHILWVIPWFRPSSSYGYTQALDHTWKNYQRNTGHHDSKRDSFKAASDFIGWYGYQLKRRLGVPPTNTYALYLAYHEGIGGYARGTYKRKKWLMRVSRKVQRRERLYRIQLRYCENKIRAPHWWNLYLMI